MTDDYEAYEAALFAGADDSFDLLLNALRERAAAGEPLTTPQIGVKIGQFLNASARIAAQEGYTDDPVRDVHGYAIIYCATAIQRLLANGDE
jgi:hypothetical protein